MKNNFFFTQFVHYLFLHLVFSVIFHPTPKLFSPTSLYYSPTSSLSPPVSPAASCHLHQAALFFSPFPSSLPTTSHHSPFLSTASTLLLPSRTLPLRLLILVR